MWTQYSSSQRENPNTTFQIYKPEEKWINLIAQLIIDDILLQNKYKLVWMIL